MSTMTHFSELNQFADVPGSPEAPELSPVADEVPDTAVTLDGGAAANDDGTILAGSTTEGIFGELSPDPEPSDDAELVSDDIELFGESEPTDDRAPAVEDAREQVRAALEESADEPAAGDGDTNGPDRPLPPTGGNGHGGGDGEEEGGEGADDGDDYTGPEALASNVTHSSKVERAETGTGGDHVDKDYPIRIPAQQIGDEGTLDRLKDPTDNMNATEDTSEGISKDEAIEIRDAAHADNLTDLRHLSTLTVVRVSPGGGSKNALHYELSHNGQDASEYLAELASELRSGSTDMPRIDNWRDQIAGPDNLVDGQVIEVKSLAELDELLAKVGGWLNNDIRETRTHGSRLDTPHEGNWQGAKPSRLLGNVRDLRGRLFNGTQVNVEAMALPADIQSHAPFTRYFTVSSQLKSTGKPPESSRPMRLVSVTALPAGYKADTITTKSTEIGRVPAALSAWLIDSQSRQIGHDVEYENRANPYFGGGVNRR